MVGQGRAIQIARNARTREQRIDRRRQQKTGAVFRKEQRLVAEWIPGRNQPACVSVPDDDGEWPSDVVNKVAPSAPRVEDQCGITQPETDVERICQFAPVIKETVEQDNDAATAGALQRRLVQFIADDAQR
jgi:hypothetical protein